MPSSEFYRSIQLDGASAGGAGHLAKIGAGDVRIGIAPSDKVERVLSVGPYYRTDSFLDGNALGQRDRFALAGEAADPVEHAGCVPQREGGGRCERGAVQVQVASRIEIPGIGGLVGIAAHV